MKRAMERKGSNTVDKKSESVAAILTHGSYKEPLKQDGEQIHPPKQTNHPDADSGQKGTQY